MNLVSLTRDHYKAFSGEFPPLTIKGLALVDGENVLGIVGVSNVEGANFIVCDVVESAPKRQIIKAWRIFKGQFMSRYQDYYSLLDDEKETAKAFSNHFGFHHYMDNIYIYRW